MLDTFQQFFLTSVVSLLGCRQDFAWVGASTGSMSVYGGSGGIFPREILKNQVVVVHVSCIVRVILTLTLRLSGPLRCVRGCGRTHRTPPPCLPPCLVSFFLKCTPNAFNKRRVLLRQLLYPKENFSDLNGRSG